MFSLNIMLFKDEERERESERGDDDDDVVQEDSIGCYRVYWVALA